MTDQKRDIGDDAAEEIPISRDSRRSPDFETDEPLWAASDRDADTQDEADTESDAETPATDADEEMASLIRQRDDYQDKWLRAVAELDNLRKRTSRELVEGRKFAAADVMRPILEVVDDFERAVNSFEQLGDDTGRDEIAAGVALIYQSLRTVLTERGVRRIEAQDRDFDPALHEAIGQQERPGVPEGTIVEVVQHGYLLDDLVLRPSRVIVAAGG